MAHYPRIRDLREDNDKTQNELADYLGTTTQYYGLYEKGANEISFERAIMIAKFYDVSLDYLAGLTNNKKGLSSSDLTIKQQELLKLISGLSDTDKKKMYEILEKLSDLL